MDHPRRSEIGASGLSTHDDIPLPDVLARIRDVAGLGAALRIAHDYGGNMFYIPREPAGTLLENMVGTEAALKIIKELGHGDIMIPFGPEGGARARREKVVRAIETGATVRQASIAGGVHMRTVKRVKAKMRQENQPDLFK